MNKKTLFLYIPFVLIGLINRECLGATISEIDPNSTPNEPVTTSRAPEPVLSPQVPPATSVTTPPVLSQAGTPSAQTMLTVPPLSQAQPPAGGEQRVTPATQSVMVPSTLETIPSINPQESRTVEPNLGPTLTNEFRGGPAERISQSSAQTPELPSPQEGLGVDLPEQVVPIRSTPQVGPFSESRASQPTPEQLSGTTDTEERTDVPPAREEAYAEMTAAPLPVETAAPSTERMIISPDTRGPAVAAQAVPLPPAGAEPTNGALSQNIFREVAAPQEPTPTLIPVAPAPATKPTGAAPESKKATRQPRIRRRTPRRGLLEEQSFSLAEVPTTPAEQQLYAQALENDSSKQAAEQLTAETYKKLTQSGAILLGSYLEPWKEADPSELVEMNFENKDLTELLKFLSNALNISFILDDYIEPQRAEGMQPIGGTKVTFRSSVPLTLKQAWELALTFLEISGFSIIPSTLPRTYRVTLSSARDKAGGMSANREPLPTFIGTDPDLLPNNDTKIRYVYFVENAELSTAVQIIDAMKSGSSGPLIEITPMRALILTDRSSIIKSIISILQEIDSAALPESLAIIRLKHTDARQVRELYHRLIGKDPANPVFNPFTRQRKPSTTQYFTEATRVFEEPYSNSLIVLGTRENIKRFEDFIVTHIDRSLDIPFSPLHVIQLKHIDAKSTAVILNETIQRFNAANPAYTDASLVGGVRDSNKFFRPSVRITEEPFGNRLIINANYEEYLKLLELIERLDIEQPQCAIKLLIMNVDLSNTDEIGTQLRNRADCCPTSDCTNGVFGQNVNFQTSNIGPIVTDQVGTGAQRLLGNLIQLANRSQEGLSLFQAGSTLVTLGSDAFGFWGLLRALESYTRVSVLANPFFVTTHKYKAELKTGETRRTTTALVEGAREAQAQGDISADLRVVITPQISYDDMVTLNIYVELGQFTDPLSTNRLVKKISTEALVANKEVIALGGLIRDNVSTTITKVPILGDIPLIGWLFKNERKVVQRTSLLILIAVEIIKPYEPEVAQAFTFSKITDAKDNLRRMQSETYRRDPIHRWIFRDHKDKESGTIDRFTAMQQRYVDENQRELIAAAQAGVSPTQDKTLLDLVKQKELSRGVPA